MKKLNINHVVGGLILAVLTGTPAAFGQEPQEVVIQATRLISAGKCDKWKKNEYLISVRLGDKVEFGPRLYKVRYDGHLQISDLHLVTRAKGTLDMTLEVDEDGPSSVTAGKALKVINFDDRNPDVFTLTATAVKPSGRSCTATIDFIVSWKPSKPSGATPEAAGLKPGPAKYHP